MRSSLALLLAVGMAFVGCGGAGSDTTSSGSGGGGAGIDGGPLGPTVELLHPGGGVDRPVNVSIYFHGAATDPTDGMLTGKALVWTDNLEGQFGTGDPVNWAPTKVGAHVIMLTGTDSLNYSAAATVSFNITP
jgi:hypothetical protein